MKRALIAKNSWRAAKSWLGWWGLLSMVALIGPLADFMHNRYQVSAQDLFLPALLAVATAALVALIFYRWWRRDRLGALVAAIIATIILGFNYDTRLANLYPVLQAVMPLPGLGGLEAPVFSLALIGAVLIGSALLGRLVGRWVTHRRWRERDLVVAVSIAIATSFSFQAVPALHDLVVAWPQFFYRAPAVPPLQSASGTKPDIYYIVLDRYASESVLKTQFGYDNSDFLTFLKDNQYYVNPTAHSNYPYTAMSIASTMSADYLGDIVRRFGQSSEQTTVPYQETIRNAPVAAALKSQGYSYSLIGNWYETSNRSDLADRTYQQEGLFTILGHTVTLDNFSKAKLNQSIFWRFIPSSTGVKGFQWLHYSGLGGADLAKYQLSSLREFANQTPGNRFVFTHILVPHDPYFVNADGSLNPYIDSDNNGAPVKQKYLAQVKYINGQIKDILGTIQQRSGGQAVVVLQADEGPYPFQLNEEITDYAGVDEELAEGDMRAWSTSDLQMKYGNLAAYHIPAADLAADTTAADSVNVFRLIFNSYFGMHLPYLNDCYYAYPNGRAKPEVYTDITKRLVDSSTATCRNDGSGPQ